MATNKFILKHSEHYLNLQYKPNVSVLYNCDQVILSLRIQNLLSRPKQICSVDDLLPVKNDNRHCYYRHCHQHASLEERGIFQKVCLPFLFVCLFVCLFVLI